MNFKQCVCVVAAIAGVAAPLGAQQPQRFDDVVRNLRNPDPKIRLNAIHLLRDAKYPEAIGPISALILDPVDDIQLEAIDAELSFFLLDEDVRSRKMIGFVIEKRTPAVAAAAFDLGPLAVWPRPTPAELVTSLLQASDDENPRVRLEAVYAAGIVAHPPLTADQSQKLIKALDHYDPAVRTAAARVAGRIKVPEAADALIKAINDSHDDVRYAAMRALGAIHETRAVAALTEQLQFYKKGEGAWSALDALAQIGSVESVPVFKQYLADRDPYLRRAAIEGLGRAGDAASADAVERAATTDDSATVRLAAAFALQKEGRNYLARLVDLMSQPKLVQQADEYLLELGPSVAPALLPRLQEPVASEREAVADALGAIGTPAEIPALEAAAKDKDATAAAAAKRAIERINARAKIG